MNKSHVAAAGPAAPPPLAGRVSRPIPGWPGYRACDRGFIWSSRLHHRSALIEDLGAYRPLKSRPNRSGYLIIELGKSGGKAKTGFLVHRLVLEAFVGPRPTGLECRHLDGSRDNNRPDNLVWGTKKENGQDRRRHGSLMKITGSANPHAKLTENDVRKIHELRAAGMSQGAIARRYHVAGQTINAIFQGKTWKHVSIETAPSTSSVSEANAFDSTQSGEELA